MEKDWTSSSSLLEYLSSSYLSNLLKPPTIWSQSSHTKALLTSCLSKDPLKENLQVEVLLKRWSSGYEGKKAATHTVRSTLTWVSSAPQTPEIFFQKVCYLTQVHTLGRKVETTYMLVEDMKKEYDDTAQEWRLRVVVGRTKTAGTWTYKQEFLTSNPTVTAEYSKYMAVPPESVKSDPSARLWQYLTKSGKKILTV